MGAEAVVERLLVIWCHGLLEEQEDGRGARAFGHVVDVAKAFSPAAHAVRPGVCAVPTRGPSRYFGGDERLVVLMAQAVAELPEQVEATIGVADGLFAAVLAARTAQVGPLVVPPGGTTTFLSPWPVEVLEQPELADLLRRLGIRTLGVFAALPTRHVLGRLGTEGVVCHELAKGMRSEPPGFRLAPRRAVTGPAGSSDYPSQRQDGFWGEAAAAEARAARTVERLVKLLHPEAVVVGRLQGGRGPAERARLVPWTGRELDPSGPGAEPWPGQLPSPAPVLVLDQPQPATVVDARGTEVTVTAAGLTSAAPARLSLAGGRWQTLSAWAGPWPVDERWWSKRRRRRRARMQLVTETGMAYLVMRERAGWWLEGAYD